MAKLTSATMQPVYDAAARFVSSGLGKDDSIFTPGRSVWTLEAAEELRAKFVDRPDESDASFDDKLKGQLRDASPAALQLMAELLFVYTLVTMAMKPTTKRALIERVLAWGAPISTVPDRLLPALASGFCNPGTGYMTYRPFQLMFLVRFLAKWKLSSQVGELLSDPWAFREFVFSLPSETAYSQQHGLLHLAFPDTFEPIVSRKHKRLICEHFAAQAGLDEDVTAENVDRVLFDIREKLTPQLGEHFSWYQSDVRAQWLTESEVKLVKRPEGTIAVSVPENQPESVPTDTDTRESIRIQTLLAEIGTVMGFNVWVPANDRAAVIRESKRSVAWVGEELPLNYDDTTLQTIERIDVLWLKGRYIARAFEVEHTTAIYSGILRMADLLSLQPNLRIQLHIVAPSDRRSKVLSEISRPVFALLQCGPLAACCTYLPYEKVRELAALPFLAQSKDSIIDQMTESARLDDD